MAETAVSRMTDDEITPDLRTEALSNPRLHVIDHPMVQHKLAILRDRETSSTQFRQLIREISLFEGYEATRDFPLRQVCVQTPLAMADCRMISGKKVAIVPILRAGLGMVDGLLELIPAARVGHVGLYRDPKTHEPHEYYCKLPSDIDQRTCLVVDPMLATGGSLVAALGFLRERGARDIRVLCAHLGARGHRARARRGSRRAHLHLRRSTRCLDENAYILPGLGDAGDRIFGTH